MQEFLAPVAAEIDGYDFSGHTPAFSYRIEESVNWKTLQEARLEGWHLPYLHEKTLARAVKVDGQQYRHTAIELHGLHCVLGSPPPDSFAPSPVALIANQFGTGTMQAFGAKRESDGASYKFRGSIDFWHIFPNLFFRRIAQRPLFHFQHLASGNRQERVGNQGLFSPGIECG